MTHLLHALLGHLHLQSLGILHLDVKPANLGIRANGVLALIDFGNAIYSATRELSAEAASHILATPRFAAPEVLTAMRRGPQGGLARVDASADLWSVALVFYSALTGVIPYTRPDANDSGRRHMTVSEFCMKLVPWMRSAAGPNGLVLEHPTPERQLLLHLCRAFLVQEPKLRPPVGKFITENLIRHGEWARSLRIPLSTEQWAWIRSAREFEAAYPIGVSIEGASEVRRIKEEYETRLARSEREQVAIRQELEVMKQQLNQVIAAQYVETADLAFTAIVSLSCCCCYLRKYIDVHGHPARGVNSDKFRSLTALKQKISSRTYGPDSGYDNLIKCSNIE